MTDDFDARYYCSVYGGWVCRLCGSLVQNYGVHDGYHEGLDKIDASLALIERTLLEYND
jgi:hypothetical protein